MQALSKGSRFTFFLQISTQISTAAATKMAADPNATTINCPRKEAQHSEPQK
jgi:hypothetical protein